LTIALVMTIALGIASNASVDGFVRGLLSQEQPFPPEALDSVSTLLRTAAIAVFAIACANVAAFLLARASARSRETAVRFAIGARRPQLFRQILADSFLISCAGAIAGAVLAYWIGRIVPSLLFDQDAEQMRFAANPSGVAMIALACAGVTILCGLLPLLETRHDDPAAIMQRESSGPSRASLRIGGGLVILQMAACTLLMVSAGLLFSSYRAALQTSTGRRLATATIATVEALQMSSKSMQARAGEDYFADIARVARGIIDASNIAWVGTIPGNRPILRSFEFERSGLSLRTFTFQRQLFTARSGDAVILPPLQGRMFGSVDNGPCGGVVLSPEAARQLGAAKVVGRSIETPSGEWSEVIGVVRLRDDDQRPVVLHYAPGADDTSAEAATYRVPQIEEAGATELDVNIVSRNYFDMLGLRMVAGQGFNDRVDACRVAIVNEQAADRYFGGKAVGGALIDANGVRTTIIGVVASAKIRAAQRDIMPMVYLPMDQDFQPQMTMILEAGASSASTRRLLHRQLQLVKGGRPERVVVKTLDQHLSRTAFAVERITTVLVGASAMIALTLGMLGLYGVMSDAARRRRREFALRIALGAQGPHVIRQVIAEGSRLVVIGTVVGLAGSFLVAEWITRVAPATDGQSVMIWIAAPLTLATAVGVASVLPARKAAASDPLLIMRSE
jgi:ABC-type antimicrobial peptide transport system permease subunit